MTRIHWMSFRENAPHPGVRTRTSDGVTLRAVRYEFEPGATIPSHLNAEEQFVTVISGWVSFAIANQTAVLEPGDAMMIAPNTLHGAKGGPTGARFVSITATKRTGG